MTSSFDGSLYRQGEGGYEEARCAAVWNGLKPARFPAVIAVAEDHDDVVAAVELAREEGLSISIRSGGHSWSANQLRDGGLLLDLSRLTSIEVDPQARTAVVEPGAHSDALAAALAEHDLYFPVGHCPSVGLGGFMLGGGLGFNSSALGPATFSLRAIDVVTADGETLHATDHDHADLLWAARGSGPGFFGVVTRMYIDVQPKPGMMAATIQIHPFEAFDRLLPWYLETVHSAEGISPLLIVGPNPAFGQDDPVLTITTYVFADDLEQAAELLAPLETAPGLDGAIMRQHAVPASIEGIHAGFDSMYPEGLRYLADNAWIRDEEVSSPALWREAKTIVETLPTARSCIWAIAGMSLDQPTAANAAFSLSSQMCFQIYAVYDDSEDDEAIKAWHSDAFARIEPYSVGGAYVNEADLFSRPTAILAPESAARVESLREKYDPEGRFFGYPSQLPPARL